MVEDKALQLQASTTEITSKRSREKFELDANFDPKESKSVKTSTPMSTSSISAKRRSIVIVCVEASSRYSQGFTQRREECGV